MEVFCGLAEFAAQGIADRLRHPSMPGSTQTPSTNQNSMMGAYRQKKQSIEI